MVKSFGLFLFLWTAILPSQIFSQEAKRLLKPNEQNQSSTKKYPKMESEEKKEDKQVVKQAQLKASADASEAWLEFVDKGRYGESWDSSSQVFKVVIPKGDWVSLMEKIRTPLGRMTSRDVVDQRTAADPKGLPAGDYMVLIYNTSFSNKPSTMELVTLRYEKGQWKVLTYQVK